MKKTSLTAIFCASLAWAQAQDAYLSAEIARDSFGLDEQIKVTYTIHNAQGVEFEEPDFSPLQKLPMTQTSVSEQYINNKNVRKTSYTFYLKAPNAGHFQIPAASSQTSQGRLESNSTEIVVIDGYEPKNAPIEEDPFSFRRPEMPESPFGEVDELFNNPNLFRFDMPKLEGFGEFPNMDALWKDFDKLFEQQFKNQLPPGAEKKDKPKDEPKIYKL